MEITFFDVLLQQLITGLSNGAIIALIALGYTMVYGIVELVNFAHGDLFMLGCFSALTILGLLGLDPVQMASATAAQTGSLPIGSIITFAILLIVVPLFCGGLNWLIDQLAYKPLRNAPRLAPLVSAIGVSFVLVNLGLFWGDIGLPFFEGGSPAAPKDFPALFSSDNLLGENATLYITWREVFVWIITLPIMGALTILVQKTSMGRAMRAVAQNPTAAQLMGINVERVIGITFVLGGMLAGVASVVYSLYNNTIYFQMGYRSGMDAFAAAVIGGIGNLPGAFLGGLLIGVIRALSDGYIATSWTNVVVFSLLVCVLVFKPSGLLGAHFREKV
jgi:branched-chain amino acid transport system permease protein